MREARYIIQLYELLEDKAFLHSAYSCLLSTYIHTSTVCEYVFLHVTHIHTQTHTFVASISRKITFSWKGKTKGLFNKKKIFNIIFCSKFFKLYASQQRYLLIPLWEYMASYQVPGGEDDDNGQQWFLCARTWQTSVLQRGPMKGKHHGAHYLGWLKLHMTEVHSCNLERTTLHSVLCRE